MSDLLEKGGSLDLVLSAFANTCLWIAGIAILSFGLSAIAAGEPLEPAAHPIVRTSDGFVRGIASNHVLEFLGIPYAAPPVGNARWRPPGSNTPWSGVRDATKFGNFCPQNSTSVFSSLSDTEDCLYLNVFAPASHVAQDAYVDRDTLAGDRPVMIWFPGGGLFAGESNDYDASKLADQGNTVIVTINYRLGALGFFAHPALESEDHATVNYGIMDQQAALRWVRANIAQFGGNPDNVTVFGQSAGGTSVVAHLLSPASKGLFQRAIVESATRYTPVPLSSARILAQQFATAAGCPEQTAACLRSLSVDQILASQTKLIAAQAPSFPVVDGRVIPTAPMDAFASGQFNRVPIMNGLVADEQAFFLPEVNGGPILTASDYVNYLASFGPQYTGVLSSKYPLSNYGSPSLAEIGAAQGSKVCLISEIDRRLSRYVPVYAYQFDDEGAPSYFPPLSYPMRAYHTSELQYLFPLFHGGRGTPHTLTTPQQQLSDEMVSYWTTFARTGHPSTRGRDRVEYWNRYDAGQDNVQSLDVPQITTRYHYSVQYDCSMWNQVLGF